MELWKGGREGGREGERERGRERERETETKLRQRQDRVKTETDRETESDSQRSWQRRGKRTEESERGWRRKVVSRRRRVCGTLSVPRVATTGSAASAVDWGVWGGRRSKPRLCTATNPQILPTVALLFLHHTTFPFFFSLSLSLFSFKRHFCIHKVNTDRE